MRIAVTGGGGFIGSHIVKALSEAGNEILVLDDWSSGNRKNIKEHTKGRDICVDVRDSNMLAFAFDLFRPDVVVHCAWKPSTGSNPDDANANYVGTVNLAAVCVMYGVQQFVFLSTGEIYGNTEEIPTPETCKPNCVSNYAVDKFAAEEHMRMMGRVYGMNYTILRLGKVFGEGDKGTVGTIIKCLFDGNRAKLLGNGKSSRDYVYVADVVEAVKVSVELRDTKDTYNFSYGDSYNMLQVFEMCKSIIGVDATCDTDEDNPDPIYNMQLSMKQAAKFLSVVPVITLDEGLRKTIKHYKDTSAREE